MFRYFLTCLLLFCYTIDRVLSQSYFSPVTEDSNKIGRNLDVVLFLAGTDTNDVYEKDDGISYLNIPLVAKIKPCTLHTESDVGRTWNTLQLRQTRECDCKKLLKASISSLMGWAHDVMGMTTTLVSLNNIGRVDIREIGKDLPSTIPKNSGDMPFSLLYENQQAAIGVSNGGQQQPVMNAKSNAEYAVLPLPIDPGIKTDDLPKLVKGKDQRIQQTPIIEAYPHEPKLEFNDIRRYHYRKFPPDFVNVHRDKRQFVIEPEDTQVFEINDAATSNEDPVKVLESRSLENSNRPKSIWDLLGIMPTIRKSFFVNFVNPLLDPHQRMLDEENGLNFRSLGQVQSPTLFQIVKKVLRNVQEDTEDGRGYLLIVFGGRLADVSDPYSDFSQSIKHVLETTDSKRTLTTVTGSCPACSKNNTLGKHVNEQQFKPRRSHEVILPVYAKGPSCNMLSKAQDLSDIPKQLKAVIKKHVSKDSIRDLEKTPIENKLKNEDSEDNNQKEGSMIHNKNSPKIAQWVSRRMQSNVNGSNIKLLVYENNAMGSILYNYVIFILFTFIVLM